MVMSGDVVKVLLLVASCVVVLTSIGIGYTVWKASSRERWQMSLSFLGMGLSLTGAILIAWHQKNMKTASPLSGDETTFTI